MKKRISPSQNPKNRIAYKSVASPTATLLLPDQKFGYNIKHYIEQQCKLCNTSAFYRILKVKMDPSNANLNITNHRNEFTEKGEELIQFSAGLGVGLGCGVVDSIRETALTIFDTFTILALKHKQFWQPEFSSPPLIQGSQSRMDDRVTSV